MNPRELRNSNHNFPHLRIRLEILVGLHRLRKRKPLSDLRMELSVRQPIVDIFLSCGELLRIARDLLFQPLITNGVVKQDAHEIARVNARKNRTSFLHRDFP